MTEIKCPNCGSNDVSRTGISGGVGNLANIYNKISPTSPQFQCKRCGKIFNRSELRNA